MYEQRALLVLPQNKTNMMNIYKYREAKQSQTIQK